MLEQLKTGKLQVQDVPAVYEEQMTKVYDDIWMETSIEEEDIFNDFYDHKCPFNNRYIEMRDQHWRRLASKL